MPDIQIIISVNDEHLSQILEIVEKLTNAGMNVDNFMPTVGVITGSVDSTKVTTLEQINGVAHVELATEFQIPEIDIQ
ncbi:hypothetical protein [Synechocystis sp. PCC 7509]|uniref:hypothetical protein n=1 Tax=Synechocystis sp. PCC 7509 TaxID=927677 RepID=UPI0005706B0E|nr:hypothetical protein [Synechocystis sp. PCC 7509]